LQLFLRPGETSFDGGSDAAAGAELATDYGPGGIACLDHIFEDLVDDVFLEDAEVAVAEEVLLEGFEFEAAMARHVADVEDAEIWQPGFGADRGQFRVIDGDFVAGELVLPCFDGGEFEVESGFGVVVCVEGLRGHKLILRAAQVPDG